MGADEQASKYSPLGVVGIINTILENQHFTPSNSKNISTRIMYLFRIFIAILSLIQNLKIRPVFYTGLAIIWNIPTHQKLN